jgi:uncharacterized protein (UPF0297 family)
MENFNKETLDIVYESNFLTLEEKTLVLLKKIEAYMIFADMKYINDPRNVNLRETIKDYMDEIVSLVVKINDLEVKVIHNDNESLMMKCECKKAKLINILTHLEKKYL